jgi:hypothetical protein
MANECFLSEINEIQQNSLFWFRASIQAYPGQRIRQRIRSDSGLWTDILIPSVGIQWDPRFRIRRKLSVGFDRPLLNLLISSFNKLMPGANFRDRSKLPIGSVEFRH